MAAGALTTLFALGKLNGMITGFQKLVGLVRNFGTATMTNNTLLATQAGINQRAMAANAAQAAAQTASMRANLGTAQLATMGGVGRGAALAQAGALATPMGSAAGSAVGAAAASGAGKVGLGAALAAAALPVGLTLLAAKTISDMTGGDFQDQATRKGIIGADEGDLPFWEVMQRINTAQTGGPGGTPAAAPVAITNGPTTFTIIANNTEDAMAQVAKIEEQRTAAQLRAAKAATGGNR